jgi:hypothetical protein
MKDYYKILEVETTATIEQIKSQYRFMLHAWHPDKFPVGELKIKADEKLTRRTTFSVTHRNVKTMISLYILIRLHLQNHHTLNQHKIHHSRNPNKLLPQRAQQREFVKVADYHLRQNM